MGRSQWRNFLFIQAIVAYVCVLHSAASVSVGFKSNLCYGQVRIGDNDLETFDDDRWDFNNSKVLCTTSSCGTALKSQKTPTSKETPDFLCTGNEKSFDECQRRNNKTQSSAKKAIVVCSDAISPPRISLTLPNGTSINSSHTEIPRGSSVSIKCAADSMPGTSKRFFLQHKGNSTEIPKLEPDQQALFDISVADYNNEGNYTCTYAVDLNGMYESAESAQIHVTVRDPWWKLLLYILPAGVLVLLLMVLSVACLVCRRRRKQAEKPSDVVLSQVMVRRSYIDDEEEEEEEGDYVNVKLVEINSLGNEEMGEKDNDSHDYEDLSRGKSDSSDDEHDYVNPSMGPVAARDGTKEQSEEEDSSDDGEDYVNLVEQTVDIYGEEVDIYDNL